VYFRGGQQEQFNATTVGELRSEIQQHLEEKGGIEAGTAWRSNPEILLFKKDEADALDDDETQLDKGQQYIAYEKFKAAPVDLFRHVKFSQVHPGVRVSHDRKQFTEVAPLFCASLNGKQEKEYPHFRVVAKNVKVHGASLFGCDAYTLETSLMPWDEITPEEPTGDFCLSRPTLDSVEKEPTEFGILRAPNLLDDIGDMVPDYKDTLDKSTEVKKRTYFWRFKLSQGTNLADVGMAVIYDNSTPGHFTLIPEENCRSQTRNNRWWNPSSMDLLEPREGSTAPQAPEHLSCKISGASKSLTFPMAAQKFEFHDFIMKASALPWDTKFVGGDSDSDDDNHDQKALGDASNIVFEYCTDLNNTHDILEALEALHKNEFKLKPVSTFHFEVLQSTIDELLSLDVIGHDEDSLEERVEETLIDGNRVIGKVLEHRSETVGVPEVSGPAMVARTK